MKKLLAFSLLFALSAANAQAAGWLNPYVGIDYAYTNAGYGNYTDKALKDQTDSYVLSAGIKILPGLAASISSLPMKKTPRQTLSFPETASKPICRCALTALTSSTTF